MLTVSYGAEICRWWLLLALLLAAWGKTIAFGRFRNDLAASFPELGNTSAPIALFIVVMEWLLAASLVGGGGAGRIGLIATAVLFTLFTAVVVLALVQDRTVVCSCFGTASHRMSAYDVARNGLLVGAALFAALSPAAPAIDLFSHIALVGIASILIQLSVGLQDIAAVLRIKA